MVVAILQVRYSSTRLSGKVLLPILQKPMLLRQIERIKRSKCIDKLVIATSNDSTDDVIEQLCKENGLESFRGSLHNVLDRFYHTANYYKTDHVVRLTGDCPLTDPEVIDQVIAYYLNNRLDYVSNVLQPTFPDGLDVEVFSHIVLRQAWEQAQLPSEQEHVTPFIHTRPNLFKLGNVTYRRDLSGLRWTVDEKEDFEFVSAIYEELYHKNPVFTMHDILELLENKPDLKDINAHFQRNEGYQKSLKQDRAKYV